MKNALIIINMQYDYCEGGPLANAHSLENISIINQIREEFDQVIFIRDLHPDNHCSFKQFGGKFPKHCIKDTRGSELHKDMIIKDQDIILSKGTLQKYDSDSIFYDAEDINKQTNLKKILNFNKIDRLYFCGNGFDDTIFSSIIDAINFKFNCFIIKDAIGFIDMDKTNKKLNYLETLDVIQV